MTKLNNYVVLSAVLSIVSTALVTPSAIAQDSAPATTTAPAAATPHKTQTAKRRTARKKAKLKSDASKVIGKGVTKAGTNLEK